jgi:hypothetical protein
MSRYILTHNRETMCRIIAYNCSHMKSLQVTDYRSPLDYGSQLSTLRPDIEDDLSCAREKISYNVYTAVQNLFFVKLKSNEV